ncbi:S8 family peptidase [Bdellovibrio bacteriovorus]
MINFSRKTKAILSLSLVGIVTAVGFTNCAENGFKGKNQGQVGDDPFISLAWHLSNSAQSVFATEAGTAGVDLNLLNTWSEGYSGKNITVLVSDDGMEDSHEDLSDNYLRTGVSKDYTTGFPYLSATAAPKASDDSHGTAVAGLIAAVGQNSLGTKGVGYKASLVSANFLSSTVTQTEGKLIDQADGDYDVFNMSWGSTQNNLVSPVASFFTQLKSGVTTGRSGKGSIYVKAAGNDFIVYCHGSTTENCVGNSNFDADNSSPYTILTTALNATGEAASYASVGSNIWISSFGGEFGKDSPAMITTDRSGCSVGFSQSTVQSVAFDKGQEGNTGCNYTATFNGTSSAAPVLSGVVTLLLEANPALTWRDVKYILAKTATPVNYSTTGSIKHPKTGETIPSGAQWEQAWVVNGAGFKFHNWYGFGRVNVDAAVALAKNYTSPFGAYNETNWANDASGLSVAIPDFSATGGSNTMTVNTNLKIESVQLKIWVTHTNIADLALELTSPSGTRSIVINMNNALKNIADYDGEVFLTNAFYRESSQGTWTLKVIDGKSSHTGTLTRWSLNFTGSP